MRDDGALQRHHRPPGGKGSGHFIGNVQMLAHRNSSIQALTRASLSSGCTAVALCNVTPAQARA